MVSIIDYLLSVIHYQYKQINVHIIENEHITK